MKSLSNRYLKSLGINFQVIKPKLYLQNSEIENAIDLLNQNNIDLKKPIIIKYLIGGEDKRNNT